MRIFVSGWAKVSFKEPEVSMTQSNAHLQADEHFNRIIRSYLATRPEFLERIIERLQSHLDRMIDLRGVGEVDYDALPKIHVLGQTGVSIRFAPDRFYVVHCNAPFQAYLDEPKVTTLRATPRELLEYIQQGSAKTDDFHLKVGTNAGVIPVACVEIDIIDQNDTALNFPLHIPKSYMVESLRHIIETDNN